MSEENVQESKPSNDERSERVVYKVREKVRVIARWNSLSVVVADNFGASQIELRVFDKRTQQHRKVGYFRSLDKYDEMVNTLVDAGEMIENDPQLSKLFVDENGDNDDEDDDDDQN